MIKLQDYYNNVNEYFTNYYKDKGINITEVTSKFGYSNADLRLFVYIEYSNDYESNSDIDKELELNRYIRTNNLYLGYIFYQGKDFLNKNIIRLSIVMDYDKFIKDGNFLYPLKCNYVSYKYVLNKFVASMLLRLEDLNSVVFNEENNSIQIETQFFISLEDNDKVKNIIEKYTNIIKDYTVSKSVITIYFKNNIRLDNKNKLIYFYPFTKKLNISSNDILNL